MKNRVTAAILVIAMFIYIFFTGVLPVFAAQNTIIISSKADFIEFAENCTVDTWSAGKTVNLTCDIDFEKDNFLPVPTFGGVFNGNGYRISGIKFSENGSYIGVFRYVQEDGRISNLSVNASFTPNGSKNFVGGIAGENSGSLENCTFDGIVKGQNVIGGIAGNNADSGQIISCISNGNITGENSTGGIAGKNSGFIQNCTNNASVNTVYEEKKNDLSNLEADTGAILENCKNNAEESEESSILEHSDTGGIVGYSSGVIQGCVNNASVGYQHVGYNVGGIAGRQSGFIIGCQNCGFIQGRKDAGGIAGQAEPYILLNMSEDGLKGIRNELDTLNVMVNRFITDTDNLAGDSEKYLSDISRYAEEAQDNAENLINQGTDFVDDNLNEINAQSAILSNTLEKLIPVFDNLESGGEDFAKALDDIKDVLEKIYIPDLSDEIYEIKTAVSNISNAEKSLRKAVSRMDRAADDLENAVSFNDRTRVKEALSELSDSVKEIILAKQEIKTALETIETILKSKPESFEEAGINAKEILENIKLIKENTDVRISALKRINESIDAITLNTEINFSEFKSAANNIQSSIIYLEDAARYTAKSFKKIGDAIADASDKLNSFSEDMSDVKEDLSGAFTSLQYAAEDITAAIGDIKDIITDLSNEKPLEFVKLGEDFKAASDDLSASLSDISGKIDELKDTLSSGKDSIKSSINSISNQFNLIMNLLVDEAENLELGTKSMSDILLDVSDEDIENTRQGKICECYNYGDVSADRNTGGISGAMAIEYAKDPEDDIEKPTALNFTYRTKAILQKCINDGKITGKKDCTGGIVGLSEIGTVYECQNYADIESTNGNFAGGIAGKSESAIHKSYAKSKVTGKRYVGGIAGKSGVVTACYTIVNVSGDENTGAICGDAEDKESLYQNFYVNNGLGAVDGISFSEKAMPITFDDLQVISGIPERFISFSIAFIADNEVVEVQDVKYGEDTARIKYPPISPKDGCFGNWQQIETKAVTENIEVLCEYKPYITILASNEKNQNGKLALALCEGEFTDKAELSITESNQKPPANTDGNIKVYDIALLNTDITDRDTVTVRILNENKDKVTAWVLENGNWEKVKAANRGKYVIMETTGTQNTVCLKYAERGFSFILGIAAVIIIIMLPVFLIHKKHLRTKKTL